MKILTVIGARPQFIKAATVSRQVALHDEITEVIVHTGQHYDGNMSDIFFDELDIPRPDYNLGIGGGLHGEMTGRQLEAIEKVLLDEKPDWVLVYGDTNSTLAGALAAVKLHIPVVHVEAGLRSFNRAMPEEINRVLTDHVSSILFCPTVIAEKNLLAEGINSLKLHIVGDVMYDMALFYSNRARKPAWFDGLNIPLGEFALCTLHRAENTDVEARLRAIFLGLKDSNVPIVLPLHPRTRGKLDEFRVDVPSNIHIVGPVGYLEMIWLEKNAALIATDSGGVQKEAYFHGKPCVTFRDETEWNELVDAGVNKLVGADSTAIPDAFKTAEFDRGVSKLYGDGDASAKIVNMLSEHINLVNEGRIGS